MLLIDTMCNSFASISNIVEVRLINEWCNKDWKIWFRHIRRESNKVADCLGKAIIRSLNKLEIFVTPPNHVLRFLEEDGHGSLTEGVIATIPFLDCRNALFYLPKKIHKNYIFLKMVKYKINTRPVHFFQIDIYDFFILDWYPNFFRQLNRYPSLTTLNTRHVAL